MKVLLCFALFCIAVLVAMFALLAKLDSIRPPELTGDPYVPPAPGQEQRKSPHTFSSTATADRYQLRYGFDDYEGARHEISCSISKADHERETATFGYKPEQIKAAINSQLQTWLDHELAKREIGSYYTIRTYGYGGYKWEYHIPGTLPEGESASVKAKIDDMNAMIKKDFQRKRDQAEEAIYRQHCLMIRNNLVEIDYGALVIRGQQPLTECFEAILRATAGTEFKKAVGLYLAFIQEIPYQVPPDTENGKDILGYWAPTEVLVHDHGDCDSKSVALSALLRSFGLPVVIVQIPKPNHVLIGVEMRPGPQQEFVRIGNRYFVLCEAAGPARLRPGEEGIPVRGHFEYTLVEPDQHGVAAEAQPATR